MRTQQRLHITSLAFMILMAATSAFSQQLLFSENFDSIALGPSVDENIVVYEFWSNFDTNPGSLPGWAIDNSEMPTGGVTEWRGWAFTDPDLWAITDLQARGQFQKGENVVAVADPDEWHDKSPGDGYYTTFMSTPAISVGSATEDTLSLQFDSSWRPEGFDDTIGGSFPSGTNNQTAVIRVAYNGGDYDTEVMRWDSNVGGQYFKPDATNETVTVDIPLPAGTSSISLEFGMEQARNDWWWAIDNIGLYDGDPTLSLVVDRDTGAMTIENGTNGAVDIKGYTITSEAGALDRADQTSPMSSRYSGWIPFGGNSPKNVVGEGHLSTYSIANNASETIGNVWQKFSIEEEDINFTYLDGNGEVVEGIVRFEGTSQTTPYLLGDFDFSGGAPDELDWPTIRDNFAADLSGMSEYDAYVHGDITGDGANDLADFIEFKRIFVAAHGLEAFQAMVSGAAVPEPSTFVLASLLTIGLVFKGRIIGRKRSQHAAV
ncbi:hypothetical protein [Aeoliella mucimassa]|uniref:PEP-CTERM protein-sorting domain-containing protein n=1 Tax=Aeoliella mucimassa TaxID=2527972 RepID=A0A518AVF2_9BACT|nr:hypothetical protein [Aeoliella mucimassa]QDU58688.1 hypothetical protein Pan181_49280 [Aeoliella mucimassa]